MMNRVEEAFVESLENFIDSVRSGGISIQTVNTSVIDPTYYSRKISIVYSEVPKKTYKTQSEIYEELFYKELFRVDNEGVSNSGEHARILANRYAVKNTIRVWREQYE